MNKGFLTLNKLIVAICFLIFISLLAVTVFNEKGILRTVDLNHKLDEIKDSISRLEKENQILAEAIRSYKSEDYQIEKIAREDLGMSGENEVIIKIIKEKTGQSGLSGEDIELAPQ